MSTWTSYALYTSNVDALLTDFVDPLVNRLEPELDTYFWVRHYAGGAHVRLHLQGDAALLEALRPEIEAEARAYFAANPSPDNTRYNPDAASLMVEREGDDPEEYDFTYRNDQVVPVTYHRYKDKYASKDAVHMMEDFYHAIHPLVIDVLKSGRDRHTELLRMYFLHALVISGDYGQGSVSFKSHWEGFALTAPAEVVSAIEAAYQHNKATIREMVHAVYNWYKGDRDPADHLLYRWGSIEKRFVKQAYLMALDDRHLVSYPDYDAWKYVRGVLDEEERDSRFLETMFENSRFMESMRYNPLFTVARVGVNLLYLLVSSLGLHTYDKFTLCYSAQQAVEDEWGYDLVSYLSDNIEYTVQQNPKYRTPAA